MHKIDVFSLPDTFMGTSRKINIHHFGEEGARPKVYIQAGTHADELPANLAAIHLLDRLKQEDSAGNIIGEIILIPLANPIGSAQVSLNDHQGRYHAQSGQNYNRGWFNTSAKVAEKTLEKLSEDVAENTEIVRDAIKTELENSKAKNEMEALHLHQMKLAHDADIALDMHTDAQAEMHLYLDPDAWPEAKDLATLLNAPIVMFARNSGDSPFEETIAEPFIKVNEAAGEPKVNVPFTTVLELRGECDTSDELAKVDAKAITDFLINRGVIKGEKPEIGEFSGIAADFTATQIVIAPSPGIIIYKRPLGDMVKPGDVILEIVNPAVEDPNASRVQVKAETEGRLFTNIGHRLAWPGTAIAKIHGLKPIEGRESGDLLYD